MAAVVRATAGELNIELRLAMREIRAKRVRKRRPSPGCTDFCSCWWRIGFRRSGCRVERIGICGNCCGTVTAWCSPHPDHEPTAKPSP